MFFQGQSRGYADSSPYTDEDICKKKCCFFLIEAK